MGVLCSLGVSRWCLGLRSCFGLVYLFVLIRGFGLRLVVTLGFWCVYVGGLVWLGVGGLFGFDGCRWFVVGQFGLFTVAFLVGLFSSYGCMGTCWLAVGFIAANCLVQVFVCLFDSCGGLLF